MVTLKKIGGSDSLQFASQQSSSPAGGQHVHLVMLLRKHVESGEHRHQTEDITVISETTTIIR